MKRVVKKVWIVIGMLLSFLVIPLISSVTRNSKTTINNISDEPEMEYNASSLDVIEQDIYLEDPIESLMLRMSLVSEDESVAPQYIENEEGELELKNVAEFKVEILGLEKEEEHLIEFTSASPDTNMIIPIGRHIDKEKWVTVRITVNDVQEDMKLSFFFDSATDSIQNATINGKERQEGLSLKYVQKVFPEMTENLFVLVAVIFLFLFLIWYMVQNKESKMNSVLFVVFLTMELLFYYFYDNYVYFQELPYVEKFYYLITGLMIAIILGLFFMLKKKAKLEWVAAYCVFGFGLIYLLILPAFSAPDEPDHFVSAYKLSNQMLLQEPTDEYGNVLVRIGDYGDFVVRPGRENYGKIYGSLFDFSNNDATLVAQDRKSVV